MTDRGVQNTHMLGATSSISQQIMQSDDWPFCRAHEPGTRDPYTRSSQSLAWRQNTVDTANRYIIVKNTELSTKMLLRQDSQSQTDDQLMKWWLWATETHEANQLMMSCQGCHTTITASRT